MEPLSAPGPVYFGSKLANRFIQPLDYNTQFHFRVDFSGLEADELGALMLAIALEKDMRHKLGYGKPLGLGRRVLPVSHLTLVDYAIRYTNARRATRGKQRYNGQRLVARSCINISTNLRMNETWYL